ncbi:MAG: ATP-dependent DNA ligase, partial [Pseudomonadota bacterium]
MRAFADLFLALDGTTKTNAKVTALAAYFQSAKEDDRLWTIALLSGRRPKRTVTATKLREWAAEASDLPLWLFEESYAIVGDLAETIALVLPAGQGSTNRSLTSWLEDIKSLGAQDEDARKDWILRAWSGLGTGERFVFNKLLTGGFRMGVSRKLMTRALSKATEIEEAELAHRLMGDWTPDTTTYADLVLAPN